MFFARWFPVNYINGGSMKELLGLNALHLELLTGLFLKNSNPLGWLNGIFTELEEI